MKKTILILLTPLLVLASATAILAAGAAGVCVSGQNVQATASVQPNGEYAKLVELSLKDGKITKAERDLLNARQKIWQLTKTEAEKIEEQVSANLSQ